MAADLFHALTLPTGWRTELIWLAAVGASAALAHELGNYGWPVLALGLSLYTVRNLLQLILLSRQLEQKLPVGPPHPHGLWRPVFERVRQLQVRSRKRKRRLSRFVTRFQEAAQALPDAALILGRRGDIQWANPAASSLLGIHWPQMAGQPLNVILGHPVVTEYLTNSDHGRSLELASPVNQTVILSLSVTPFGRKHQRLVVARDITRAYHLDQAQRDFVANVSHELRTPLTVIKGFLENLLDMREDCPQWVRSLELMQSQAFRMQNIIEDLLFLSRLEMQGGEAETSPVPVADLLASVAEEARRISGDAKHDIQLRAQSDLWLRGNAKELHSSFSNLVLNAVRHTPGRSLIQLTWCSDAAGARFSVSDTGEGIPARHIPRLSERFYRVDTGRSRETGGTGLGLAIAKHVLERHGGDFQIESEVGRGSTFACLFPPERVIRPGEK